jgi:PAS domain S-box-containing protein
MKRSRLFLRVLLTLVALFGAATVLSALLAAWLLSDTLHAQYRSKGEAIAHTIANASVDHLLLARDAASLQAMVDLYAETEGVGYILVQDRDGEVMAHTFVPEVPAELRQRRKAGSVESLRIPGEGVYLDVSAPILEGEIGRVHVGMRQDVIDAGYWRSVRRQSLAGGLIGLAAVVAAYLLARRITRPLEQLTAHARKVASLEKLYEPTSPVSAELAPIAERTDEIGQLAQAFRHMIGALTEREMCLTWAEQSLRLSERKFRSLIENVSDVVLLLNDKGEATYVSPSLRDLLDFSAKEWIDRDPTLLIHPDDRAAFREALASCLPVEVPEGSTSIVGESASVEVRMLRADGSLRIVDAALCNLRSDLAVKGVVVTLRDITDRKRTVELQQARDAAEEASRLKSQFLTNISHEIRTPMHHILGLTELALGTNLDEEQRDYLETTKSSAEGLLTILNDILDFSRIEAGRLEIETAPFRIRDLVGDAMKLMAARAHAKGLELPWEVSEDVPEVVVGDANRLRRVLLNLVGNGIKFTARGEVGVVVRREPAGTAGAGRCALRFLVRDTGIGIAAEKQQMIFEPFVQADGTLTRKYGGTGLGLAIARSLVELMGGKMGVQSKLDEGSVFHFTAIVEEGSEQDVPREAAPSPEGLQGLRALVVDDNATNGRILATLLRSWGVEPVVVDGGPAALRALDEADARGEKYQLILVDAQMPEMDGYTLAGKITARLEGAGTLVMLSSADRAAGAARCRELGLSGYLTKPVKPAELLAALLAARAGTAGSAGSAGRRGRDEGYGK